MKKALVLAAVAGTVVSSANAQTINWSNIKGGSWSVAGNWNPANVPDTGSERAIIGLAGKYVVQVDTNIGVLGMDMPAAGAAVHVLNARQLVLRSDTLNDGRIVVNPEAGGNLTLLQIEADGTFTGAGEVVLNASENLSTAWLRSFGGGTMIRNGAQHTIRGTGYIGGSLVNEGLVTADVTGRTLQLELPTTNNAIITATNGGVLLLSNATFAQGVSGMIVGTGAGSVVSIQGGTVVGGTVRGESGGVVRADGLMVLQDVRVEGAAEVMNNRSMVVRGGGITNAGTITVNPLQGANVTLLQFETAGAIGGSGDILLNASENLGTAILRNFGGGTSVTIGPAQVVHGSGQVSGTVINQGTIQADAAGRVLLVDAATSNESVITSINGGVLQLGGATFTQVGGGRVSANGAGSTTHLTGATVNGGVVSSVNGGMTYVDGPGATINAATVQGPVAVTNARVLTVRNTGLTNNGTITVNDTAGGNFTGLQFEIDGVLGGTGAVVLNANPGNLDTATARAFGGGTVLRNSAAHTIRGTGRITGNMVNDGNITANVSGAVLDVAATSSNNNTMSATNGGVLQISSPTMAQSGAARLFANGGVVSLNSTTITGGRIETANGGVARVDTTSTANNVTFEGNAEITNGRVMSVRGSGITNNAAMVVNPGAGGNFTALQFEVDGTLGGAGSLVLNANEENLDTATARSFGGGTVLRQSAGHTIRGTGRITGTFVNDGQVRADIAGRVLDVAAVTTNNATLSATNGGTISLSNNTFTQGVNGRVFANGGVAALVGATVVNGRFETANGGVTRVMNVAAFTEVTNAGAMEVMNAGMIAVRGAGFTNNGVITVNPQGGGNATFIQVEVAGTIGGTGSVILNASSNLDTAIIRPFGGGTSVTNGAGHTIGGRGRVYTPFTNAGIMAPGELNGGTARLEVAGTWTNMATAVVNVDIGGDVQGTSYDHVATTGTVTLAGTLNARLVNGFVPARGSVFEVMTAANIKGRFTVEHAPELPMSYGIARVQYTPTAVRVRIPLCRADWNASDGLNSQDFFDFLNDFFAGTADYNRNGATNSQDFFDFLNDFFRPCTP